MRIKYLVPISQFSRVIINDKSTEYKTKTPSQKVMGTWPEVTLINNRGDQTIRAAPILVAPRSSLSSDDGLISYVVVTCIPPGSRTSCCSLLDRELSLFPFGRVTPFVYPNCDCWVSYLWRSWRMIWSLQASSLSGSLFDLDLNDGIG